MSRGRGPIPGSLGLAGRLGSVLIVVAALLLGSLVQAPLAGAAPGDPLATIFVPATSGPIDGRPGTTGFITSGVTLQGEVLVVTATGTALIGGASAFGPNGNSSGFCFHADTPCPGPNVSAFSLLVRVGGGPWFLAGTGPTTFSGVGAVEFAFNDGIYDDNSGGFTATLIYATTVRALGSATYGDTTATLTANVRTGSQPVPTGGQVRFTFQGAVVGTVPTNAQGVATLTVPLPAGTAARTYLGQVRAEYFGDTGYQPSAANGPLVVARKILWVKSTDRTVGLRQPNPPTTPPVSCVAAQTPTSACWLELARGSTFVNGDDWADLSLAALRFSYNRNPPVTNASEFDGKTYRITAIGAVSSNYDLRYDLGTLTARATP